MSTTPKDVKVLCAIHNITHDFKLPNGRPLRVLEEVSLNIHRDEVIALLGPSGCGKSTLLRIFAGLVRPTAGQVLYHGQPLVGLNPGVAIVFQQFALYPWMTVEENIHTVLRASGMSDADCRTRIERVLRLVGLKGFEESNPRELSAGMTQRVGMARALAVDPEILFLDEPFSQVDALTAESLRAEVLDIFSGKERRPLSILMVSHDIKEVAYMADRIVILGANPGTIRKIVTNDLPRPRDYRSPALLALVDQLHEIITGHELPDEPVLPTPAEPIFEPLPEALPGEIIGLLEYLDARGGRQDVFHIASDTHREFGHTINVVKAAEMLNFVDTPKRMVVIDLDGRRFVQATPEGRRAIFREQLLKLRLFQEIVDALRRQPEGEAMDRDFILETLILRLPEENYEKLWDTLLRWGQYAELFDYDDERDEVQLMAA
ncbi:MAG TPA: nitrate/sulfonate/bicarbonate ABC transporter ATP-binding protein [Gemmatales bacterium]|nr:nitrate/sulfonate/bicarbonate ABC transporter ATP-binding protein [Gemmatales bacterium]